MNKIKMNAVMHVLEKRGTLVPDGDANLYLDALQVIRDLLTEREQILEDMAAVSQRARERLL